MLAAAPLAPSLPVSATLIPKSPAPLLSAHAALLKSQARDCADTAARMAALQASAIRMPR